MKKVHAHAILFLFLQFIFSNLIFIGLVSHSNNYVSYIGPFVFSIVSSFVFLYLFSHKDFFKFMGVIEKEEKGKEKGYISDFIRYGKYITCILISQVGGPVFLALTIRFLFSKDQNRYLIALISTIGSTIIGVAIAKGFLSFI